MRKTFLLVSTVIAAGVLLSSCGKGKATEAAGEAPEAPTPVTVEAASLGAIDNVVTADAVLYPINQANVTPKISAPVKRVLVNRGDHVRAGRPTLIAVASFTGTLARATTCEMSTIETRGAPGAAISPGYTRRSATTPLMGL